MAALTYVLENEDETYLSVSGESELSDISELAKVLFHLFLVETVRDSTEVQCTLFRVLHRVNIAQYT